MDNSIRELYQEIILDHGRSPRNFGKMSDCNHSAFGDNPMCGDEISVYAKVDQDDKIEKVSFDGRGCAISIAAASLLTEVLQGLTVQDAKILVGYYINNCLNKSNQELSENLKDRYNRLLPFNGVKAYPSRIKCAVLAWYAFEASLNPKVKDEASELTVLETINIKSK